jgi:hypothetical protein
VPSPLANSPAQEPDVTHTRASGVFDIPALLRLWHLASMDAPSVAVVWSLAFAWAMNVRLPAWVPLLLALGTWTLYVGDRLLDARAGLRNGKRTHLRERHYFHWRHRRVLLAVAACTSCAVLVIIFKEMPLAARNRNSILAAAALAYFSGVHAGNRIPGWLRRFFSKELLVGVLFTAGCMLPTFSRMAISANLAASRWPLIVSAIFFAAIAWLNCRAIECWESGNARRVFFAACILGQVGMLLVGLIGPILFRAGALLAAGTVSALLLALLDSRRHRIAPLALRALADVVLLTPALLLWIGIHPQ